MFSLLLLSLLSVVGKSSLSSYFGELLGSYFYNADNADYSTDNEIESANDYANGDYAYDYNEINAYNYANAYDDEIIGGLQAFKGEFSSLVRIVGGSCGGTIIAKQWILTAAHCVRNGRTYTIVAGDVQISKQAGTEQTVKGVAVTYAGYRGRPWTGGGNIALIKLEKRLTFNKHVNRVRLAKNDKESAIAKDDDLVVAGWGGSVTTKDVLSSVRVLSKPAEACKNAFGRGAGLDAKTKCVGTKMAGKTICGGDNGGGGYVYRSDGHIYQVGVVTWGLITCDPHAALIDVYHFIDWISTQTGRPKSYFTSPVVFDTDWMCMVGIDTPLRAHNGHVECMSNDDKNCIWGECLMSIRNFKHTKDKTSLSCGGEHKKVHKVTGYHDSEHWCHKGREYFTNNHKWRCLEGVKSPLRKTSEVECMSRDDTDCLWSTNNDGCAWHILIYQNTLDATTLSCGAEHSKKHGGHSGYRTKGHWCTIGSLGFA